MDPIVAQAEREFPYECCGFVIGDDASSRCDRSPISRTGCTRRIPAAHPRDARIAFLMEPKEHLAVLNEIDRRKLKLKIVYHSHPDHDAYFSPTDRAQASCSIPANPTFPIPADIVMSIRSGKFARAAAFVWDAARKEFVETTLDIA